MCLSVVSAATLFPGCKTFIHEQNAYPGIANRKLAKKVDCVMINFPEAARYLKAANIKVTGLPVRHEIMEVNREAAIKKLGLKQGVFTLLAFGGSRELHPLIEPSCNYYRSIHCRIYR